MLRFLAEAFWAAWWPITARTKAFYFLQRQTEELERLALLRASRRDRFAP